MSLANFLSTNSPTDSVNEAPLVLRCGRGMDRRGVIRRTAASHSLDVV